MKPEVQRQNLLLSATLNEKVNHLANISLENPVMIGLDNKKMLRNGNPSHVSLESDVTDIVEESRKMLSSSNEEYKLPAQLVQRYIKGIDEILGVVDQQRNHLLSLDSKYLSLGSTMWLSTCSAPFHFKASL